MGEHWDCIVIGGGAAGFFAAIECGQQAPAGSSILILEKSSKLLGKVKISGGGRCNVTHHCYQAKELTKNYPRGEKSLIGPFHRWGAEQTVQWFEDRGVSLKVEKDGRMFPITDDSNTIIKCLLEAARSANVTIRTSVGVSRIQSVEETPSSVDSKNSREEEEGDSQVNFRLTASSGRGDSANDSVFTCQKLLIATGGTRLAAGAKLATQLGHTLAPAVPSLFTMNIEDERLSDIPGISVERALLRVKGSKLRSEGPLLVTHWGLSGPAILKLSAWGARELHERDYQFELIVNWLPNQDVATQLENTRTNWGKRTLQAHSPFPELAKRLWTSLVLAAGIEEQTTWAQLTKPQTQALVRELSEAHFPVTGKSLNKDEFVTCGGVLLKEIQMKTMQSKILPDLYFAGEVMDIDGITGGFNFQNAWCSGYHAGQHMALSLMATNI